MHSKRWLTGIIAVPVLIYLIGFAPRWLFYALLCAAGIVGLQEFFRITGSRVSFFVRGTSMILAVLLFAAGYMRQALLFQAIIVLWAFFPMGQEVFSYRPTNKGCVERMGLGILGPVYTVLPLALLVFIDMRPQGHLWIFFLLAVVFACDTGAFYFGRSFGRHKLHERLSPGKTWEGAVGGLLCSLMAAMLFLKFVAIHPFNFRTAIAVVLISAASQIGDLAESVLKRTGGIKDSGNILPGHGGILDRTDGLLFAIPVFFLYLNV